VESRGDWDPVRARDVMQELGLTPYLVGAMGVGRDLVDAPDETIRATQSYLRHCLSVAKIVGAKIVAGPFYAQTGRTWRMSDRKRADALDQLRETLRPVIDDAGEAGLTVAIEPLNRYETSLINTVDQAIETLEPLLGPACG